VNHEVAGLGRLLDGDPLVLMDRASAELRAGRPIAITHAGRAMLLAALDGVSPSVFSTLAALPDSCLGLSARRAEALGLHGNAPIAVPLGAMSLANAMRLAHAPNAPSPANAHPADPAIEAAIALCKHAMLLPAVLAAPIEDSDSLPAGLYRVPLERLTADPIKAEFGLEIVSEAKVPLAGNIATRFVVFRGGPAPRDQVAIVVGDPDPSRPIPVRLHSACLTGDLFGSLRCDCGDQLRNAVTRLGASGGGVLLYLDQEGRGIGIGNKMRSYALQDQGYDTIDADNVLGFDGDERRYDYAAAMLAALGYRRIVLLTNNPGKIDALRRAGIEVVARQPLTGAVNQHNLRYLHTKARRADHMLDDLLESKPGPAPDSA
jgi:GTP cyclohydrolase II